MRGRTLKTLPKAYPRLVCCGDPPVPRALTSFPFAGCAPAARSVRRASRWPLQAARCKAVVKICNKI